MAILEILNFVNFVFFATWLSVIDLREKRLPNKLMYPAISIAAVVSLLGQFLEEEPSLSLSDFLWPLFVTLLFFIVSIIYPKGIGMGDVKGILLLGISMVELGGQIILSSIAFSFFTASIYVVVSRLLMRSKIVDFPFGPFLFAPGIFILAAGLFA